MARPTNAERGARIALSAISDILAPDLFGHSPEYLAVLRPSDVQVAARSIIEESHALREAMRA